MPRDAAHSRGRLVGLGHDCDTPSDNGETVARHANAHPANNDTRADDGPLPPHRIGAARGLCSRGHTIASVDDVRLHRDGPHCARCVQDANLERDELVIAFERGEIWPTRTYLVRA